MTCEKQRRTVLAFCLLMAASAWSKTTLAYHTDEQRLSDDTADVLERGKWRVGLFKLEYTLLRGFHFGTYPLPWLFRVPNAHVKWRYYAGEKVSLAARLGYLGFDTKSLDKLDEQQTHATLSVVPFDLSGTWRVDRRFSMSLALIWTGVFVKGELDRASFDGTFQGGTTNLQSLGTLELRVSRVTALLLQPRFLSYQRANVQGDLVLHPDDFTTVEVHGLRDTDALDYRGAYSVTLSAVFSWQLWNLRLGLGYGNYNVPGLNFMLPERTLFPDFDLYLVF